MNGGAVLRIRIHSIGTHSRAHYRVVHRQKEVATGACGRKAIGKLDAHRPVLSSQNQWSQKIRHRHRYAIDFLHITPKLGATGPGKFGTNNGR